MGNERKFEIEWASRFHNDLFGVMSLNKGKAKLIAQTIVDLKDRRQYTQDTMLYEWPNGVVTETETHYEGGLSEVFIGVYGEEFLQSRRGQTVVKTIDTLMRKYQIHSTLATEASE